MKKPFFGKVCIVGVGLIGGSIGMAVKKRRLARSVAGVVRRRQTAEAALKRKAVDETVFDLASGVSCADLVILSSPVRTILQHLKILDSLVKPGAIVIDVGSSKYRIDKTAKRHLKKAVFVGCHPMAGSSKRGVDCADASPDLFLGAVCFMTSKNAKIRKFWNLLGSRVVDTLSSREHDEWAAGTSYSTHVAACALLRDDGLRKLLRFKMIADNPSFKEAARLSKCDPDLWADILLSNPYSARHVLSFEKSIAEFREALAAGDRPKLKKLIAQANVFSNKLSPDE